MVAGQALSTHPDVAKVTFTGSIPVGSKVMEACAKVSTPLIAPSSSGGNIGVTIFFISPTSTVCGL